ncbi:MAG TPA: hypothetical protein VGP44_08320 [Gemmatimonadales bacterium]|nr:hypothetical protein [Gemmatimonadales bacterium]
MNAPEPLTECDNCRRRCPEGELIEPSHLWERLDPGAEVPAGECPECGALAYLVPVTFQQAMETADKQGLLTESMRQE